MTGKIPREEYLDKAFDYSKLTKQEMRQIMSENDIEEIPPLTSLKSVIMDAYKTAIHDKIDLLKGKFSSENIFQSPRKVKINVKNNEINKDSDLENSKSMIESKIETSFIREESTQATDRKNKKQENSEAESSFLNETPAKGNNKKHNPISKETEKIINNIDRSFYGDRSSFQNDLSTSDINATISKFPEFQSFIKTSTPIKSFKKEAAVSSPKRVKKLYAVLMFFIIFVLYMKFICPYCNENTRFCVLPPNNSIIVNGKLECKKGFKKVFGIIDYCEIDKSEEKLKHKKVESIIRFLEHVKGGEEFGAIKAQKIKITDLTTDNEIIEELKRSNRVIITNSFVEARFKKVSIRIAFKYYLLKIMKYSIPIVISIFILKLLMIRRSKRKTFEKQAMGLSKEISEILSRQLVMSSKSNLFKPYIYEDQIKDVLEIKTEIWSYVKSAIEKNSNIELIKDDMGKYKMQWVGPILPKNESNEIEN